MAASSITFVGVFTSSAINEALPFCSLNPYLLYKFGITSTFWLLYKPFSIGLPIPAYIPIAQSMVPSFPFVFNVSGHYKAFKQSFPLLLDSILPLSFTPMVDPSISQSNPMLFNVSILDTFSYPHASFHPLLYLRNLWTSTTQHSFALSSLNALPT